MLLFWRIRYLDTHDRQFKDRDLWLETDALDPVTKGVVEATHDLRDVGEGREMLRYRHLFREHKYSKPELENLFARHRRFSTVSIVDYFEDENGAELTPQRMGPALTGEPNTVMIPGGAKQHDIDFMFAPKPSIDLSEIQLPTVDLSALAYFSRDLRELEASSFLVEGAGMVSWGPGTSPVVQTAVTEDEIRSFVTVFRRVYMENEPGNFLKAAGIFARALLPHPVGKWVQGVAQEYEVSLQTSPDATPFARNRGVTFTRKRRIDVFLNTQFAHQGEEKREKQYADCLAQVGGHRGLLFWLFLDSLQECTGPVQKAGGHIASFTARYCKAHGLTPSAVGPPTEGVEMGALEKRVDKEARVLREKTEELAMELWKKNGRPVGGPMQFLNEARHLLAAAMGQADDMGEVTK
jgi:hypothetical protein